ncbi:putative N-(5'-phospho-L-ribosyl-formimino)-5-amino-1-(5'-phosphoribosyl)-4-imidazolecarb oxamide isomerase [Candidatus Zinderia insecticola CARI]|uniref:1-(5-phosphoribosyl)-5-[(5-phosphoribosylamino)methylideneamino] imidazole-4-carboxamide isomerase n=1 Tax=Zinderia insecticola (strain CARI) TaxID=871271 RepID=E0TJ09_ZINIC|nr:putative N-(5'-phospho-L-ribosyl-formimino)-5-amino-1-(5'-phosphoribosyl)-4-imidazolecarb oxamide isomerase [Candidatus Zinderia insecticola CARI]
MILIPAIDIKNGKCVRLKKGNINNITIYHNNPVNVIKYWLKNKAKIIHIVDLDGAIKGIPINKNIIKNMIKERNKYCKKNNIKKIPIQLGGGIRNLEIIKYYFKYGISNVILGTSIIKNFNFIKSIKNFKNKIIISLDSYKNKIVTNGWKNISNNNLFNLANKISNLGFKKIIYTDIERDGILNGINIENTINLAKKTKIKIIASGGLYNLNDIKKLCKIKKYGIIGVICGRSIYNNILNFNISQKYINKYFKYVN